MSLLSPSPSPAAARRERLWCALAIYGLVTCVVFLVAAPATLSGPTPYNHFALLAQGWLEGRLDLGGPPPHHNDFAAFGGKYYVVFPPFPAVLLVPFVALAGSAAGVRDGVVFLALSGVAPAVSFLALEKLRALRQSDHGRVENIALALVFAFGSVYFFTAVQGTVWFAAHVVGAALAALYLLFALGAERPFLAGLALALGMATRTPLAFAAPLFVIEAIRVSARPDAPCVLRDPRGFVRSLDGPALLRRLAWFIAPLVAVGSGMLILNAVRFGDPLEFGYRYLTIVWRARIERWGLFSYHYFPRNLAVITASLPWVPGRAGAPFAIHQHGLALWFTTPLYLLALWPRQRAVVLPALWAAIIGAALPSLFYQNTGWQQFGQRFSNDYAVFLFAALAAGGWRLRRVALGLALWSIVVNGFGALTFGRPEHERFYVSDPRLLFQPD